MDGRAHVSSSSWKSKGVRMNVYRLICYYASVAGIMIRKRPHSPYLLFSFGSFYQWSDACPGYMLHLEGPKFAPKTTYMAQSVPSRATMGTPWQAQTKECVKRIQLRPWVFGQGMRQNVNVS